MKITTKTGDRGETGLFGGRRVSKASMFIEMVGQLDELQSYVGWARCAIVEDSAKVSSATLSGLAVAASAGVADEASAATGVVASAGVSASAVASAVAILDRIQDDLYRMMTVVGSGMKCPDNVMTISEEDVEFLEKYIVGAQDSVKNLSKFIRPGSSEVAARLHIARTVCRRVERRMVAAEVAGAMLRYLNRLSDLLFVLGYKFEKK